MSIDTPRTLIFFGRSGSGKGTQAKKLVTYLKEHTKHDVLYIETGKKFRELMRGESYTSVLTREVIESGGLMPEFLPVWVWAEELVKQYSGNEHVVFDGVARREDESPVLHSALKFYKCERPIAIYLDVSRECAFEMLKSRGRPDDTDENIKERLDWFDEKVQPAIYYFREQDDITFLTINGEQSIEEVHNEVLTKIQEV